MNVSRQGSGRTGRRPGTSRTRDEIASAARARFADAGYDRTTIRAIAADAGVDPALVLRFYGSKENLFREVMALPAAVADAFAALAEGPRETVGRRLAELVVGVLENPATRTIVLGRIRSATSHPDAAALVRETVARDLLGLAGALTDDEPLTRATLVGAHFVGVALARHIVLVAPLSTMTPAEVVDVVAPTFQHCLTGPLRSVPEP
jgi:AcrR family transcriptional regulator